MGIYIYNLVGGLEHEFYDFPYIGNVIIPTDFHIFQRGRYTTNQSIFIVLHGVANNIYSICSWVFHRDR